MGGEGGRLDLAVEGPALVRLLWQVAGVVKDEDAARFDMVLGSGHLAGRAADR